MRSISPAQSRKIHCFGLPSQGLRHYSDEEPVSKEYQVRFSARQHHQRYLPGCFGSIAVTGAFLPLLETEACSMAPASLEFVTLLPPLLKCLVARSFRGSGLCHSTNTISPHPFKEEDNLSAGNTLSFFSPIGIYKVGGRKTFFPTCLMGKKFFPEISQDHLTFSVTCEYWVMRLF